MGVTTRSIRNYEQKKLLVSRRATRIVAGHSQEIAVYDPRAIHDLDKFFKDKTKAKTKAINDILKTDTSSWLTRNESSDLLRLSTGTLKNYERQGKLHPLRARRRDGRGHDQSVVIYDPKELARLPKGMSPFTLRTAGEIEARSFEMFEQGKSFREIVIALRETSETVHGLHERWLDDGGSFLVISDVTKQDLEEILGPFKDVVELVDLVAAKCGGKENNACHENGESPASPDPERGQTTLDP
jgi:DNA-binding transcriptional MerR regulator